MYSAMSIDPIRHLLVGLPESGKSTFLAALWHVVESSEIPGSLVLSEVHGIRDYLNTIRDSWLRCEKLERTRIGSEHEVRFKLTDAEGHVFRELILPDPSGEMFKFQWEIRRWSTDFDKLAATSEAVMMFVHPRTVKPFVRLDSKIAKIAAELEGGDAGTPSDVEPWTPDKSPTQVQLIELLQFLMERSFIDRSLNLSLIISAWDLIRPAPKPSNWVQQQLPLLYQFLMTNSHRLNTLCYGVSAQGGDYSSTAALQSHNNQSERIMVVDDDGNTSHDITIPLKRNMGQRG